jgi:hypothetical protein
MMAAMVLVILFFVGAVLIEVFRRRRDRQLRLKAEWKAVGDLARERDCSAKEVKLLEEVVARHAPDHPFRAVTARYAFDDIVEREMNAITDPLQYKLQGVALRDIRMRLSLDYAPLGQRINSTRELHLQQQVWVSAEGGQGDWFRMMVSIVDEAHFYITPQEGTALPPFKAGDELRFRLWRAEDARYIFSATVDAVESAPPALMIHHTTALNRRQSRAHYRLRFDDSTDIALLSAPADGDYSHLEARPVVASLRGHFTSLSGGGFAVVVNQATPKQVLARVTLSFGGHDPFQAIGRIVGVTPLMGGRYLLRAAFVGLEEEHRDKITHYIFQLQQRGIGGASTVPLE